MENACKEFVRAIAQAEKMGGSVAVDDIGKRLSRVPPGKNVADVFEACKDKGWAMGSKSGVWLTPAGNKAAINSN